ncbi:MAG: alpha/beta hydrolase [Pseudomonadota bacterium]
MAVIFPEVKYVDANGIRMAYYEQGEGPALVLAHGWPELSYSWRYQISVMAEAGYRVIVPDQRGYGKTDKPDGVENYDIHHLCGDHVGLLDALGIDKALYIGHDWGAIVSWHMPLLHPERVAGVIGMSVPFVARGPSEPIAFWEKVLGSDMYIVHFNRQPGVAEAAFEKDVHKFLFNMYRKNAKQRGGSFGPGQNQGMPLIGLAASDTPNGEPLMSEEELQVFVDAFEQGGFACPINWYRNFTRNWNTTADMPQTISQPCAVIYGEYDAVPQGKNLENHIANLETFELPCGHWIQQEMPEETNKIVLDWLESHHSELFN